MSFAAQHGDSAQPSIAGGPPGQPPSVVTQRWHGAPDDTACAVPFTPPQIKNRNTHHPATPRPGSHPGRLMFAAASTAAETWRRAERPRRRSGRWGRAVRTAGQRLARARKGSPPRRPHGRVQRVSRQVRYVSRRKRQTPCDLTPSGISKTKQRINKQAEPDHQGRQQTDGGGRGGWGWGAGGRAAREGANTSWHLSRKPVPTEPCRICACTEIPSDTF